MKKFTKINVFEAVNKQVLDGIKKSGMSWFKAWSDSNGNIQDPINRFTKRGYNGVNIFILNATASIEGYASNEWVSFAEAKKLGSNVMKGEKSTMIVYWHIAYKVEDKWFPNLTALNKAGYTEDDAKKLFTLKQFRVFNIAQCSDIQPCREIPTGSEDNLDIQPIDSAEAIVNGYKNAPKIVERPQDRAYYTPMRDTITMPTKEQFVKRTSIDDFYKVLFHEMIHSTGHSTRLDRKLVGVTADKVSYSKEELIAEIGAMYLTSIANLNPKDHERQSQAYINGWIKFIKSSHEKALISAMTKARQGVDLILK
jgi:antirestriction protein ArdC